MLELREIRVGYRRIEVVHGVDLILGEGEVLGMIGPNGAGKSSILRAICGLVRPTSGETVFEGVPVAEQPDRACGVWVVDIRSGEIVAFLRFEGIVQEVFDVQVIPRRFPEITEPDDDLVASSYILPEAALADVPESLRGA